MSEMKSASPLAEEMSKLFIGFSTAEVVKALLLHIAFLYKIDVLQNKDKLPQMVDALADEYFSNAKEMMKGMEDIYNGESTH
jgi:hypothetical protein